ncbi:MAG: anthranilate synthase component I family protein [Myxococcales bacterium]|nr:anthranilate synthase component I family protein [Myxococcales bacterium]
MSACVEELVAWLSAGRVHRVVDVALPCALAGLVRLPEAAGPLALLDRAVRGSPYATTARVALAPRFTLTAGRLASGGSATLRMPWDDAACPPRLVDQAETLVTDLRGEEPTEARLEGCPLGLVERLLRAAAGSVPAAAECGPYACGFVGFFGDGVSHFVESLQGLPARPREAAPDLALLFTDAVLFADDADGWTAKLSLVGRGPSHAAARSDAEALEARVRALLAAGPWCAPRAARPADPAPPAAPDERAPRIVSRHSAESYSALVARAKESIAAGEVFQLCVTHTLAVEPRPRDPAALYEALRASNPAPFSSYVRLAGVHLVSSSPERFLRIAPGGAVQARPIKGTRPRGATPEEDARLALELAASEKDGAENDMIVDLLRNDLARVSAPGSVRVRERRVVEPHAQVHQLVSTIESRLAPGRGAVDVLRAAFPPGSMTGAPKVRAVELLADLEPHERGVYSGAIGYLDVRGALDTSVAIRTFVLTAETCTFGVGGGVVHDSQPLAEWEETLDKARALVRALAAYFGRPVVWEHRP